MKAEQKIEKLKEMKMRNYFSSNLNIKINS